MNPDVFLTGSSVTEDDVHGRVVVVIDVLRASSTITAALHHGARAVIPVADMAYAGKIASNMDPASYVLGGERNGDKIEGYHLGNSPLEYTANTVHDRTIILSTTNGTRAIARSRAADCLVVASFLNASKVVSYLKETGREVTIVCAGKRDRVCLEDTLCAGMLLDKLWREQVPAGISDTARIAHSQFQHDRDRLEDALRHTQHAQHLVAKGYHSDVDFALRVDALPLLPMFVENQLVLHHPKVKKAVA